MRILVVDDDPISRTKLEILLSAYGKCDTASAGSDAIERFAGAARGGEPYDLVTMDIEMPDMDGPAVVKQLRDLERELGVDYQDRAADIVMVTVRNDLGSMSSSFWRGCQGYLAKPVTPEDLQEALARLHIYPART